MASNKSDCLVLNLNKEDEYSIPLNISDILIICKEFNKLGWGIQQQIENILEFGVKESIESGFLKQESLPFVKNFLNCICQNPYFGDATSQAEECIELIEQYEKYLMVSLAN